MQGAGPVRVAMCRGLVQLGKLCAGAGPIREAMCRGPVQLGRLCAGGRSS